MSEPTTTEPRNEPVTAQDKRALRHADSIVFRLYKGQATIEANLDAQRSPTGFEQKHLIYVGGAHVTDYSREHSYVPEKEWHRYSGFHMEHSGVRYNHPLRTLVDRLRIGGTASLHWIRGNSSPLTIEAGLVVDVLYLHITQPPMKAATKPPVTDVYMVDYSVSQDNSARMVKVDWNGV